MKRRNRNTLLAASLVFLTACLDISFSVAKSAQLKIDGHSATFDGASTVDLSTNSDFQSHKDKVTGIALEKVEISIASLDAGNAATKLVSASVALRADAAPADGSQDVQIGAIGAALPFNDYLSASAGGSGTKYSLSLSAAQAADKFMMDNVVKGAGKFTVVVHGQTDAAETHMTLLLDFGNSLSYSLL